MSKRLNSAILLWDNGDGARVDVPYWSDWDWIATWITAIEGIWNANIGYCNRHINVWGWGANGRKPIPAL